MRIFFFSAAIVCAAHSLPAQEKGATPIPPTAHRPAAGVTRAVVIGISDYQDERIPDLQYAHRDAEAFAEFLRSKAGGGLTEDQIMLLTNEKAKNGQIYMALDWLLEETEEGDLAIIFFSGHGDAEVKLKAQRGFLLTHNSVAETPKIASIRLNELEDHIVEIALDKKARVLVITDACRSGMLAGREGGAKMANTELAAMSDKAVKILSCQPDEMSHEGMQWGGGRGAFSYFLVNGLYGLADQNTDRAVTLTEIGRYLEDNVSREVSPSSQIPKVVGSPKEKLATVFPDELAKLRESLDPLAVRFKPAEQRGLEDETLARLDSATRAAYRQFKQAVAAKQFFEPADACADTLYRRLTRVADLQPLYSLMKRNYAAALMDDAQEAMNGWLRSDPKETESWGTRRKSNYLKFPVQLERAAELLGKKHYLYHDLKAKEYFFRTRIHIVEVNDSGRKWDSLQFATFLYYVEQGLKYDSLAPYLYTKMGYYYAYKEDPKKGAEFMQKAIDLAPSWVYAYAQSVGLYSDAGNSKKARENAVKACQLDSTNLKAMTRLSDIYQYNHQFEKYKQAGIKIVEIMESNSVYDELLMWQANIYLWYGYLDKSELKIKRHIEEVLASGDEKLRQGLIDAYLKLAYVKIIQGDVEEAEKWWLKCNALTDNAAYFGEWPAWAAFAHGHLEDADRLLEEHLMKYRKEIGVVEFIADVLFQAAAYDLFDYSIFKLSKAVKILPEHAPLHYHLARIYLEQKNDYSKGVPLLERAVQLDSSYAVAHYHLAAAYAHLGKNDAALEYMEKALELGYEDWEELAKDARWERLRGTERYRAVMEKYFSEGRKD